MREVTRFCTSTDVVAGHGLQTCTLRQPRESLAQTTFFSFCFVFFLFFFYEPLVEAWGKTGNGQKPALIMALSVTVNCRDSPHLAFKKWLKCQLFSPSKLLWLPVFPFDNLPEMKWFMCVSLLGRFYAVDLSVLSGLATSALRGGPKCVWFCRSSSFILLLEWENSFSYNFYI